MSTSGVASAKRAPLAFATELLLQDVSCAVKPMQVLLAAHHCVASATVALAMRRSPPSMSAPDPLHVGSTGRGAAAVAVALAAGAVAGGMHTSNGVVPLQLPCVPRTARRKVRRA